MPDKKIPRTEQTQLQRLQADALVYKPVIKFQYFKFNQSIPVKQIFIMPKNHMIQQIIIRVLEGFNGANTFLNFSQQGSSDLIGRFLINDPKGQIIFVPGVGYKILEIFMKDTMISYGITELNSTRPSTRGSGWGVIQYLDMGQVDGFSN